MLKGWGSCGFATDWIAVLTEVACWQTVVEFFVEF